MLNTFRTFISDESGAAAAEYALILAVVGAAIATAGVALKNAIVQSMKEACTNVNTGNAAPTTC